MDLLSWLLVGVALILLLGLAVLKLSSWPVQHTFRDQGIETPPTSKLFGHFLEAIKYGLFDVQTEFYFRFKGKKVYGWYDFRTPVLVLRDLDLIKDVMVKQFSSFVDRRVLVNFDPPFDESLLAITGEHWKKVRNAVSPTFSSGRLKKMSRHVERNVGALLRAMDQKQESNEEVELKDIMSRFTMDTIASTGFGLDIDTLGQPDNEFCVEATKFLNPSITRFIVGMLFPPLDNLLGKLGYTVNSAQATRFFMKAIDSAIQVRKEGGHAGKMHDFLDLVINAQREEGEATAAAGEDEKKQAGLSRAEIHGQALLFLLAGYETVSTVLSFTLFLLATHPECQRKAQEELDQKLPPPDQSDPSGTVPSFEAVQGLTYLDQCINEAMRLYPPGVFLDRVCTEDITLQGIKFPKGMPVTIPVYAIHMDPDIWPEPHEFRPERFEPEVREARHQFAFLPFGHGPRNCVGMRLGQLELKAALASVLQRFEVLPCQKTVFPVKLCKSQVKAKDGVWVRLERRAGKR